MAYLVSETEGSLASIQKLPVGNTRDSGSCHLHRSSVLLCPSDGFVVSLPHRAALEMWTPPGSSYLTVVSFMIPSCIRSQSVTVASLSMLIKAKRSICLHSDHTIWKSVSLWLAGMWNLSGLLTETFHSFLCLITASPELHCSSGKCFNSSNSLASLPFPPFLSFPNTSKSLEPFAAWHRVNWLCIGIVLPWVWWLWSTSVVYTWNYRR